MLTVSTLTVSHPAFASEDKNAVSMTAAAVGYTPAEIRAGMEFADRKARRTNPPGTFDKAGRFYATERTQAVLTCRSPSRSFPYPEMGAARTAAHCAEVFNAESLLAVKRVAKALDALESAPKGSAHQALHAAAAIVGILKPIKR